MSKPQIFEFNHSATPTADAAREITRYLTQTAFDRPVTTLTEATIDGDMIALMKSGYLKPRRAFSPTNFLFNY